MYKTVRHGENSLQYKILAQQEEGVTNVKCRKSSRTVTAKLIAVITLLVIGIIASAVLVPLVLTNDFIALTGTFQKFSVSTLRRSHSGNHVVVLAKKPFGWNAPRSSVSPKLSNNSQSHPNDAKKSSHEPNLTTSTTAPTTSIKTTASTTVGENLPEKTTPIRARANEQTQDPAAGATPKHAEKDEESGKLSPTTAVLQQQKSFQKGTGEREKLPTTPEPIWFEPVKKWGFRSSDSIINGMNGVVTNPVSILASFLFVIIVVIMFFMLRKTLGRRRTLAEKETAESKEDKTRLLKPSVSSDHDEE